MKEISKNNILFRDPNTNEWVPIPAVTTGGATAEQVAQIEKNTSDISQLSEEIANLCVDETCANLLCDILSEMLQGTDQSANIENLRKKLTSFGNDEEPDAEVTLTGITASYTGSSVDVGTDVNDLRGIIVTASYSDGSNKSVTGYTLSGTISEGSNIITVSYGGKITTFTVEGNAVASVVPSITKEDFTASKMINDFTGAVEDSEDSRYYAMETAVKIDCAQYATMKITNGSNAITPSIFTYDSSGNFTTKKKVGSFSAENSFDLPDVFGVSMGNTTTQYVKIGIYDYNRTGIDDLEVTIS